jgi:hypothetical protein
MMETSIDSADSIIFSRKPFPNHIAITFLHLLFRKEKNITIMYTDDRHKLYYLIKTTQID